MKENYMVCNCKQVSYFAILDALHEHDDLNNVLSAFDAVKEVTHCSTGCGGCHDKVMKIISDEMMSK